LHLRRLLRVRQFLLALLRLRQHLLQLVLLRHVLHLLLLGMLRLSLTRTLLVVIVHATVRIRTVHGKKKGSIASRRNRSRNAKYLLPFWLRRLSLRWQAKKHGTARAAVFQTIQRDSTSSSSFRRIL
jgi:hypothetical protein